MRYPASEKLEIIRLVEQSHLPVRRTLAKLGIQPARFDPPPFQWTPVVGSKSQEVSDGEGKAAFLYRGLQTTNG
jgi:hypothetical protein